MRITDLITGLAFVNAHVGLVRLDKGLRDGVSVPIEQLQAHVQMVTRSTQVVMVSNQIQQLKGQASKYQKQQLNAQHAQLMVQISQLQIQLQQLQVERQRFEMDIKKEQRLAQENQILRLFVDMFDQAQTYRQSGRLLDYIVVVLATFRIYRQIYNDLDDANNRLRISELKEKLFQGLREVFELPDLRHQAAVAYVEALQTPMALLQRGREVGVNARNALVDAEALRQPPSNGDWAQSIQAADISLVQLEQSRAAVVATRVEYATFTNDVDTNEFFFPAYSDNSSALVGGISTGWKAWVQEIESDTDRPLVDMATTLREHQALFQHDEPKIIAAIAETQQKRVTHQFGLAATQAAQMIPAYLTRFQELQHTFKILTPAQKGSDLLQILDGYLTLKQMKAALATEFTPIQTFAKANTVLGDSKYISAAAKRMQEINASEEVAPTSITTDITVLDRDITKLDGEISTLLKSSEAALDKAVETDVSFQQIQQRLHQDLKDIDIQAVETQVTSHQPSGLGSMFASFRGDKGKENDRRRRSLHLLAEAYVLAHPLPPAELPDVAVLQPFPSFGAAKSGFLGF